jgi:superfamily II DNA or RNA helicase
LTQLRQYQTDAADAIMRELRMRRSTMAELATGTGKSLIAAEVVRRHLASGGMRALVVAHRRELLTQLSGKLREAGVTHGFHVDSIQAIALHLASYPRGYFDLIIIDESHHAAAKTYRRVVEHFVQALVVGFTATAERSDGAMLGSVFGSVAYRYGTHEAIRDGWLVPPHPIPAGRFSARDLIMRAANRPTIVFAESVAAAIAMTADLNSVQPGCAAIVHGEMSARERDAALDAYRAGLVRYLCNCALLTEGTDLPATACVAIVRAVNSRGLRKQIVGRAMRLSQGKQQALILDYHGYAPLDLSSPQNPLEGRKAFPRGQGMKRKPSLLERVWRFLNWRIW